MTGTWTFHTRTRGRPGYTVLEGSASFDGQTAEFFLVVGSQHISLDVQCVDPSGVNPSAGKPGTRVSRVER